MNNEFDFKAGWFRVAGKGPVGTTAAIAFALAFVLLAIPACMSGWVPVELLPLALPGSSDDEGVR